MDATIKLLWDFHCGRSVDAYNCACDLFMKGLDTPLLHKMVRLGTHAEMSDSEIAALRELIGRPELAGIGPLCSEVEAQLNRMYLDGLIGGWDLIQKCCDLICEMRQFDQESDLFWIALADDAYQHGCGICIRYPFNREDFDAVLRKAILENRRSVAEAANE